MVMNPQPIIMTVEEYLAFDNASETKHEYYDGEVVAMSGGTIEHSKMAIRIVSELELLLGRSTPCRVYNSDIRTLVSKGKYVYADAVVSCDVADHEPGNTYIRSPHLIVEVLSPATEFLNDRGLKLNWYKALPSVKEYMLVNYRMRVIEIFRRVQGNTWINITYGPGETVALESLDLELSVDEIYDGLAIPLPSDVEE